MTVTSTLPGIPRPARLAGWISGNFGGEAAGLANVRLIAGGRAGTEVPVATPVAYCHDADLVAFGYGKLAVVLEGIHARHLVRQRGWASTGRAGTRTGASGPCARRRRIDRRRRPAHAGPGPAPRSRRALPLGFRLPSL